MKEADSSQLSALSEAVADERDKRFKAERLRRARRLAAIQRDAAKEVARLLRRALEEIRREIALTPPASAGAGSASGWEGWRLPRLQAAVEKALREVERGGAATLSQAAAESWRAGIDLVDKPAEAALPGLNVSAALGEIDTRQLLAMRAFMTDRMKDVSVTVANRINAELGLVAIGARTQSQAADTVAGMIKGGRERAITVIRTELGRAFSTATQERMAQATELLPGLMKQWRRSGKIHSRATHDIADGQTREVDEPFIIGGKHKLMFPRDPKAPPSETINCGCTSLPFMAGWQVSQPGRRPFSDEELAKNPAKRLLMGLETPK